MEERFGLRGPGRPPVLLLTLLLLLAACARPDQSQLRAGADWSLERPAVQTLTPRHRGLTRLRLRLRSGTPGTILQLTLRDRATGRVLRRVPHALRPQEVEEGWVTFAFEPVREVRPLEAEVRLLEGEPPVLAWFPLDGVDGGALAGTDGDLTFRAEYRPDGRDLLADLGRLWRGGRGLLALLLLGLPGLALLLTLWPDLLDPADPGETLLLAAAATVALLPILDLVPWAFGIQPWRGRTWLLIPFVAALLLLGRRRRPSLSFPLRTQLPLLALVLITLALRLWTVRDVEFPLWGDSVHHALIVQLLLDRGGLFDGWAPYAPLTSFTYHFGLHSGAAFLARAADLPAHRALLLYGQLLNALATLLLYPLGKRLAGRPEAGLAAAFLAAFLFPMPAFYVQWGRYTQLAGQVVLAFLAVLWLTALEAPPRRGGVGLLALGLSAQLLTHYRVTVLAAAVLLALTLSRRRGWARAWRPLLAAALLALALTLPWLLHLRQGRLLALAEGFSRPGAAAGLRSLHGSPRLWLDPTYTPRLPLLLALLSLPAGALPLLWIPLWALAANPQWFGLGVGIVPNFTVALALYLPLALAGGIGWVRTVDRLPRSLSLALTGTLVLWGLLHPAAPLVPLERYRLAGPEDVRAAAWLDEQGIDGRKVLSSGFTAYGDTVAVGSDGGWWFAYLRRQATGWPPITYAMEGVEGGAAARRRLLALARLLASGPPCTEEALRTLRREGIEWLYAGKDRGQPEPHLDPLALVRCPGLRLRWSGDGAFLFQISGP